MEEVNPIFARRQESVRTGTTDLAGPSGDPAAMGDAPFEPFIKDYYLTNPISRASAVMAECSRVLVHHEPQQAAE